MNVDDVNDYCSKMEEKMMISNFKRQIFITGLVFGILSPAVHLSADTLKVGLAAEPTSVDPHYHNLTINNSMATQVFDALVLQDVNQKLIPGWPFHGRPLAKPPGNSNCVPGSPFTMGQPSPRKMSSPQ